MLCPLCNKYHGSYSRGGNEAQVCYECNTELSLEEKVDRLVTLVTDLVKRIENLEK